MSMQACIVSAVLQRIAISGAFPYWHKTCNVYNLLADWLFGWLVDWRQNEYGLIQRERRSAVINSWWRVTGSTCKYKNRLYWKWNHTLYSKLFYGFLCKVKEPPKLVLLYRNLGKQKWLVSRRLWKWLYKRCCRWPCIFQNLLTIVFMCWARP